VPSWIFKPNFQFHSCNKITCIRSYFVPRTTRPALLERGRRLRRSARQPIAPKHSVTAETLPSGFSTKLPDYTLTSGAYTQREQCARTVRPHRLFVQWVRVRDQPANIWATVRLCSERYVKGNVRQQLVHSDFCVNTFSRILVNSICQTVFCMIIIETIMYNVKRKFKGHYVGYWNSRWSEDKVITFIKPFWDIQPRWHHNRTRIMELKKRRNEATSLWSVNL
jgi:hypothetical protein